MKRRPFVFASIAALLGACAIFSACAAALSPDTPSVRAASDALAARQHQAAAHAAAQAPGRRLWFAGFAMHAASPAFQGDLDRMSQLFADLGGPVLRYEHSNEMQTAALRYPFALPRELGTTVKRIASQARAGDVAVLLISTHGAPKALSVNAAGKDREPLTAAALAALLAPLGDTPTVVILSACYSGSFIPELRRDTRIILTAASAQRSSYGCDAQSRTTFFIEEMFEHRFDASLSLLQLDARGRARIAQRERAARLKASHPQLFVGRKVRWLARRPLRDWLQP